MPMRLYSYNGPVMEFDRCIANCWVASTYAPSEQKARCNLSYRFKKETNRLSTAKIALPGKIKLVE